METRASSRLGRFRWVRAGVHHVLLEQDIDLAFVSAGNRDVYQAIAVKISGDGSLRVFIDPVVDGWVGEGSVAFAQRNGDGVIG